MTGGSLYRIAGIGEVCIDVRTNYLCPLHTHDTYSVGRFHGAARIWCRGRTWDIDPGCIVLLEPGEPHRGTPLSRSCGQDGLLPVPALMTDLFGGPRTLSIPCPIVADAPLAEDLSRAASQRNAGALRELLARLFACHGQPVAALREPAAGRELVPDIARSVAAASRAQGMSRSHFSRTLRAQTGLAPRDLRRQLRVARARALIEGGHDLASAALASGFADQAHMTRQLRSLLGVTPAALRRR